MKVRKCLFNILFALSGSVFLTGCYTDFTPDIDTHPVLCINSLITAGESISVDVTRSWVYTDIKGEEEHDVKDAVVTLYANEMLVNSDYLPKEGDRIRICVHSRFYGDADADVTVPFAPAVDDVMLTPVLVEGRVQDYTDSFITTLTFDMGLKFTISDSPESIDYYHYALDYYSENEMPDDLSGVLGEDCNVSFCNLSEGSIIYKAEPIFSVHISEVDAVMGADVDGFTFFTDRQFSGASYKMNILYQNAQAIIRCSPDNIDEICDAGYIVSLSSVSESYYSWFSYAWQSYSGSIGDLSQVVLSEPLKGYSNVSTGAGVVAARAVTRIKIPLDKFLIENVRSALDKLKN